MGLKTQAARICSGVKVGKYLASENDVSANVIPEIVYQSCDTEVAEEGV